MSPTRRRRDRKAGKPRPAADAKPRKRRVSAKQPARATKRAKAPRGKSDSAAAPRKKRAESGEDLRTRADALIHELRMHQVELEIQNEELRQSYRELAAAHEIYADLYEFAPVGYVTLDLRGAVKRANLMAAKLLGVDRRRLLQMSLTSFIASQARNDLREYLDRVAASGQKVGRELPVQWAGRGRILYFESMPIDDGSGFRCALFDVTERRHAEEQLEAANRELEHRVSQRAALLEASNRELQERVAENERLTAEARQQGARLRTILDSAAEGILTCDVCGRIEIVNHAAERIFGYRAGEMVGIDMADLIVGLKSEGANLEKVSSPAQPAMQLGRWRDLRCRRKQGDSCYVDLSVSQYEETEPKFTAIARDVTERRRLQREIAQRVTEEQQAIGRTLHDGVAQYLAAAEMMVGVLQRGLGETPTPMADVTAELLRVTQDAQQELRAVMRGVLPYTVQAAGLEAALLELAATVQQLHGIDCVVEKRGEADVRDPLSATQLFYIASEAVHNAVRHARASQVVIAISLSDSETVVSVGDDGIGIAPQAEKHGAGMGIMRYRASLIDADLTVRNGIGGGTVVTCRMCLSD